MFPALKKNCSFAFEPAVLRLAADILFDELETREDWLAQLAVVGEPVVEYSWAVMVPVSPAPEADVPVKKLISETEPEEPAVKQTPVRISAWLPLLAVSWNWPVQQGRLGEKACAGLIRATPAIIESSNIRTVSAD